ncbi:MAG: DUF1583 domain-containing protein, partial [Planctomycetia bacterium]|nr:DUF1583 domain-containing protein [Planctomycetia bacterium]
VALARDKLDDAKAALTELAQLVGGGGLPPLLQLACHAALPASDYKELEEPAYEILRAAVNLQMQTATADQNNSELSLGRLVSKVNRHLSGEPEQVKKLFESYLVGRQSYYARYSGTSGQYYQWRDWAAIAEEAAKTGLPTVALDYMGRVADFSYENRTRPSTTTAMAVICREMSLLSPEKQYEAWRDWTLPLAGRQTIRLAAEWVEPVRVPQSFLDIADVHDEPHAGDMLSNFTELLTAAEAANRLEELRDLVKPAYDQKLENAAFLYAMILIQLGDLENGRPVIEPIVKTIGDRVKRQTGQPTPDGWGDYLLFRACWRSPQFGELYANERASLLNALRAISNSQTLARLNVEYVRRYAQKQQVTIGSGRDPQLTHWFPATTRESSPPGVEPWWGIQEDRIVHLAGAGSDLLYFAYPVTGEFEFTIDAWRDSWSEADAGYGGVVVEGHNYGSRTNVWSTGGHESIAHPQPLLRDSNSFGTVTIKVAAGEMRYVLNNHVIYKEKLSGTSPWLTLYTDYARTTTFRNPRFTGNPSIPRSVTLVAGDRMDGWNTSFFSESQPRHRLMAQKPESENNSLAYQQRDEPSEFDWRVTDGVLVGRAPSDRAKEQSWAYYHRPLRDRESFQYDFFHVPGESVAHPTIGRLALLIEPAGIDEHWITRPGWDDAVLGLMPTNRLTNAAARRGPGQLPLKVGEWNRVGLSLAGETLQVRLNDELVYERVLDAEIDHRFGLYRGHGESLQVREPQLTGDWPTTLGPEVRDSLLASSREYTDIDRQLTNAILGEKFFEQDAGAVVRKARDLLPEQAYEVLAAWVLPSASRSSRRLYFELVATGNTGEQEILCPAVELIAAADRAGKMNELAAAIEGLTSSGPVAERGKIALQALVAMHSGDFELSRALMAQLCAAAAKGFSIYLASHDRAIEFVVAWQAAKHPALQFAALDISNELVAKQRDQTFRKNDEGWGTSVDLLHGHVDRKLRRRSLVDASRPPLTQWANIPYYKPDLRAKGYNHTIWLYDRGVVQHVAGGTWGQLFFQSPLRGKFEITGQRGLHGYREAAIAYGMHSAEPRYDYKAKRITKLMHSSNDIAGEITFPGQRHWVADFRIAVDGTKITTFVNGVQLHEETLTPQPDPWVVLQAFSPGMAATVRNLRIVGTPQIPDEINLIDIAGWASWRADMYGKPATKFKASFARTFRRRVSKACSCTSVRCWKTASSSSSRSMCPASSKFIRRLVAWR